MDCSAAVRRSNRPSHPRRVIRNDPSIRQRRRTNTEPPRAGATHQPHAARRDQPANRAESPGEHRHPGETSQSLLDRHVNMPLAAYLPARCHRGSSTTDANHLLGVNELVLSIEAIHLARPAAERRDHGRSGVSRPERRRAAPGTGTRAVESRAGDEPGLRPLARRGASPSRRPFHRRPASQGVCLCVGFGPVIGCPYFLFRHPFGKRDIGVAVVHQLREAGARALGDLSILLVAPSVPSAKRRPPDLSNLRSKDQTLIGGQRSGKLLNPAKVLPHQHDLLKLGAQIDYLDVLLAHAIQRQGNLESALHRAPPGDRPTAILDARYESLLEYVCQVIRAGKRRTLARVGHELERRLAEAVLKILSPQPVAMGPEQKLTPSPCDERHILRRIAAGTERSSRFRGFAKPIPTLHPSLVLKSGRHIGMSTRAPSTPPLQSRRPARWWSPGGPTRARVRGRACPSFATPAPGTAACPGNDVPSRAHACRRRATGRR